MIIVIKYSVCCKILCLSNWKCTATPIEDKIGITVDKIIIITHDNIFFNFVTLHILSHYLGTFL
jgi:hypothetical protein